MAWPFAWPGASQRQAPIARPSRGGRRLTGLGGVTMPAAPRDAAGPGSGRCTRPTGLGSGEARGTGQQGQRGQRGAPAASGNLATLLRLDKPNFPGVGGAQAAAKLQSSRRYLDRPPHYKLAPTAGVSLGRAHLLASPRANVCSSQCECVPCAWCVSAGDCVCRCEHELRPRRGTHVCGTRV